MFQTMMAPVHLKGKY